MKIPTKEELKEYFDNPGRAAAHDPVKEWLESDERIRMLSQALDRDAGAEAGASLRMPETAHEVPSEIMHTIRRRERRRLALRVAAVVLPLLVLGGVAADYVLGGRTVEIHAAGVESMQVALSDGSRVELRPGTKLVYPARFARGERRVSLSGEAFFEVARDESRRFVVKTDNIDVEVLGTSFHVTSKEGSPVAVVRLESGSVEVRDAQGRPGRTCRLVPGQTAVFSRSTGACNITGEEWRADKLLFSETPLADVLGELERAYGVRFEITDPRVTGFSYNMVFDDDLPLENTLSEMEFITPVRFRKYNDLIEVAYEDLRHK